MTAIVSGWGIIGMLVVGYLCVIGRYDESVWHWSAGERVSLVLLSGVYSCMIYWLVIRYDMTEYESCLWYVVAACLLFACMTDSKSCQVFQFTWWPMLIAGVMLWCKRGELNWENLYPILVYIALQELFFSRYYGRADCHAFVMCALVGTSLGWGMVDYVLHMLVAFVSLFLVQIGRHNISGKGNLKHPVAFLPYVTFGFWVLLFFGKNVILKRISEINL